MIVMDFGGKIKGASGITDYDEWVPLDTIGVSAQRAISFPGVGKDRAVDLVQMTDLSFSRASDVASPDLFGELLKATIFPKAKILVLHATSNKPIITIEFTNLMIVHYSLAASRGTDAAEHGSFNYTKISYQYDGLDAEGKAVTGTPKIWDLIKHVTA